MFIARNAAKQRAEQGPQSSGKIVIHPVAIRYFFLGNLERALEPVLEDIERRLSWRPQSNKALTDRIVKVGEALLTLKELEYQEKPQGRQNPRTGRAADGPYSGASGTGMAQGQTRGRHWGPGEGAAGGNAAGHGRGESRRGGEAPAVAAARGAYLAQQLSHYPPDYFSPEPTKERLLETVERFEEDLTDHTRIHRPIHAAIEVGEAIEVPPGRDRGTEGDSMMGRVRARIETMLEELRARRPPEGASEPRA